MPTNVMENNETLTCMNCGSRLEFDMKSATPLIASLPEAERTKMGSALFSALVDADLLENPRFAEAIDEDDLEVTKEPWYHSIRDSVKEKDVIALGIMAGWFIKQADRRTMLGFIYYMEHERTPEPEPSGPAEVIAFPKS